jgi:hypothetical protein
MRACILNSQTKIVENVIELRQEDFTNFFPYKDGIELAPQHDGEIGWTWTENGWYNPDPGPSTEYLAECARHRRNKYLTMYVDSINPIRWESLTQQQKDVLIAYRQELLDIPQQPGFPTNITWPTPPEL